MKRVLAITVLGWVCHPILALDPAKPISQYITSYWDAGNGLPRNRIASIVHGPDGLIWISTTDGDLASFDGARWIGHGLPLRSAAWLFASETSALLVGPQGEQVELPGWGLIRPKRTEPEVWAADAGALTRDGTLWLATSAGLQQWDGARYRPAPYSIPVGRILSLAEAENGDLYIGGEFGLVRLCGGRIESTGAPKAAYRTLSATRDGTVLAVADGTRVYEARGDSFRLLSWNAELQAAAPNARIAALLVDRDRNTWLNLGNDGIARVAANRVDLFTAKDGLPLARAGTAPDRAGYWAYEDRHGAIWFGLNTAGIVALNDSPFRTLGPQEGLTDEFLWSVLEDREGAVWAATNTELFRSTGGRWASLSRTLDLPSGRPRALLEAKDGSIWVSFPTALIRFQRGIPTTRIPVSQNVFSMAQDGDGRIWISGRRLGTIDLSDPAHPKVESVDFPAVPRVLKADRNGGIWLLCLKRQTYRYHGGKFELMFNKDTAESLYEDERGVVWLGTANIGLCRIRGKETRCFGTRKTVGFDDVHSVVEDRHGYLWLSSNTGLRRVKRSALDEAAEGKRSTVDFQQFTETSGLRSSEFQAGNTPSAFLMRSGSILMPSTAGLVRINPDFDFKQGSVPSLQTVQVAGVTAVPDAEGAFDVDSGARVSIRLATGSGAAAHSMSYRLEGFDEDWQDVRPGEAANYTNLPAGQFPFLVRVAPFGGEPTEPQRLMTLQVSAPFYRRRWFLALAALAAILIGLRLSTRRARAMQRQKELLESEVLQRTAQLQLALRNEREAAQSLEREIAHRSEVEQQLIHAQKMETVDRLAGGVAHDFNNLLTIILANLEMAKLDAATNPQSAVHLDEIEHAAHRASDLTRQLLTFARRQVVEPKNIDLNSAAANMGRMLRRITGESIELAMVLAPDAGCVRIDPGQFEQVLVNLVINARDAMPDGGKITIETERRGERAVLTVADTGIGMDAQTSARVFEPFFTTKRSSGGTGLGLAICYGIVRQAGGEIKVESKPGVGSRFEIVLPVTAQPIEPERIEDRRAGAGGTESILLAEDEDRVREMTANTLRSYGYQVTAAANGQEALQALESMHWKVDLVIADVVMPLTGGRALADRIASVAPDVPILYISGYTEDAAFQTHLQDSGRDFLAKPFTLSQLVCKVRQVLDGNVRYDLTGPRSGAS